MKIVPSKSALRKCAWLAHCILQNIDVEILIYHRLVSLVGKVPVYCAGGLGSIPGFPGRTNTQGLKIIEEKVLPLL